MLCLFAEISLEIRDTIRNHACMLAEQRGLVWFIYLMPHAFSCSVCNMINYQAYFDSLLLDSFLRMQCWSFNDWVWRHLWMEVYRKQMTQYIMLKILTCRFVTARSYNYVSLYLLFLYYFMMNLITNIYSFFCSEMGHANWKGTRQTRLNHGMWCKNCIEDSCLFLCHSYVNSSSKR